MVLGLPIIQFQPNIWALPAESKKFVKTGILFSMVCYWQEAFVNQWHIVHSSFPTADAVICGPQMGQFGYFFLVPLKMLGSA